METELKTYSSDMLDLAAVPSEDWHKAKYLEVNASENALIDEIIDLKRKLNAMVRLCQSIYMNEGAGTALEDDLQLWDDLGFQGYGGDEVPE